MWKCPQCKRTFITKNQWHSCVIVSPEEIFINKPRFVKELYNEILRRSASFGDIKIDTTLSCLYLVGKYRFLAVKPQNQGLIIEFALDRNEDIFPVIKTVRISKNQFVHRVKLDSLEDLNSQIMSGIKEAYFLKNR